MTEKPLAIDLCCGLSGWGAGLVAEGWRVIGFDIENMFAALNEPKPEHFSLVIQDILTLHGSQFCSAELIVASPPCQAYSWMAMPWSAAKAKAATIRADETGAELERLNRLFNACFRIQREACEAAGRHIPMVVENVRGAIPWLSRSKYHYGSYHLWGDVPALMPSVRHYGSTDGNKRSGRTMCYPPGSANPEAVMGRSGKLHWQDESRKVSGFRFDGSGRSFQSAAVADGRKHHGDWFSDRDCPTRYEYMVKEGQKAAGWMNGAYNPSQHGRNTGSKSPARKAASAKIAKIPLTLSTWIGQVYFPK